MAGESRKGAAWSEVIRRGGCWRAYAAGDKARVRGIGGAWLARRLWKEVLAGEAAKGADRGAQGRENRIKLRSCPLLPSFLPLARLLQPAPLRLLFQSPPSASLMCRRVAPKRKRRSAAAAARAQALHDQLLSRRTVVDNPLSPRRRQYGRGLNAGVQTFAMADRTPNSATDRAQNSFMYMLSDKPIHKFVKVIFREAVLEDFDPEDYPGAASDEELLKFVVPWTAGPPVVLGPQPAGEDPRSDAGLAVDRYPYTGSTDADDKNNLADATLFAFVGTATESKAQAPPILFEGTGAGVDLADRSKFLSLGSAWSAARTIQANPMTGVGVGRISGTQGFVWDIEGAVVRDWRGEESGRDIFAAIVPRSEPVAGTNFSAGRLADLEDTGLFAAKEVTGFHVLGIVGTAPSRSGRINQNVFVFGNDGAKSVRDNLLEAAGVAIVDEPAAGGG